MTQLVPGRVRRISAPVVLLVLLALLAVTAVISAAQGQYPVGFGDVVRSLGRALGWADPAPDAQLMDATLWNVRFPRVVLGLLIGAALAVAGALMQGVFTNPLAEPGVIGVSSGCAVGACAVIVFDLDRQVSLVLPAVALLGGLTVAVLVYLLASSGGTSHTLTLILTGIAVNAVAAAVVALLVFLADTTSREQIVFWQMGSLNGATWPAVRDTAIVCAIGLTAAMALRRRLDLLVLGESASGHVGVAVERLKRGAILCAALLSAGAVAYAGLIGFVGLVVPHLLRLVIGPSHRFLIPASALGGAVLLAGADIASRTLIPYADLPIGIFTAVIGGPMFFLLLRRQIFVRGLR